MNFAVPSLITMDVIRRTACITKRWSSSLKWKVQIRCMNQKHSQYKEREANLTCKWRRLSTVWWYMGKCFLVYRMFCCNTATGHWEKHWAELWHHIQVSYTSRLFTHRGQCSIIQSGVTPSTVFPLEKNPAPHPVIQHLVGLPIYVMIISVTMCFSACVV